MWGKPSAAIPVHHSLGAAWNQRLWLARPWASALKRNLTNKYMGSTHSAGATKVEEFKETWFNWAGFYSRSEPIGELCCRSGWGIVEWCKSGMETLYLLSFWPWTGFNGFILVPQIQFGKLSPWEMQLWGRFLHPRWAWLQSMTREREQSDVGENSPQLHCRVISSAGG